MHDSPVTSVFIHRPSAQGPRLAPAFARSTAAFVLLLAATGFCRAAERSGIPHAGAVELDVRSQYSHIRIYRTGNVRTLVFVRDSGVEVQETQVDLANPHELHFTYLQHLFLSYVFRPQQERVLIVGVGGGSMIHFLKRYDPEVRSDAVEIDPVVVDIAEKYFNVRSEGNVNVVTADAFDFLADTKSEYDVIYMDAFLKPSRTTDSTGAPLRLRTLRFYRDIQKRLKPGGLVAFNLNPHAKINSDVRTIRAAFPQVYVFRLPRAAGLVAVASVSPQRMPLSAMLKTAKELDHRFHTSFSFQTMARRLVR